MLATKILGTGSYLPENKETTEAFLKKGAPLELIERWGVYEHRVMPKSMTVTDMEATAALRAIQSAGLHVDDIELIICATALPRQLCTPNSNALQEKLGARRAAAFDINMACAGNIAAMIVAAQFIALNQYKYVLVTGSSYFTAVADQTDAASFIVLGDGAGAVVMGASKHSGILAHDLQSNGRYYDHCGINRRLPKKREEKSKISEEELLFYVTSPEDTPEDMLDYIKSSLPNSVKKSLSRCGIRNNDIDLLVAHQNISPIVDSWVNLIGIHEKNTVFTYQKYGNMPAANIFVNLDEAVQNKRIKDNDIVVFAGQGAGFSVGSIVYTW
ncbi:3-oxoacyl-ACP synthase III family protein [Pseudomonadota bacterium]